MMFTKTVGLAAAAFAAIASALPHGSLSRRGNDTVPSIPGGGVVIVNNLADTVYAWSVANVAGPMQTLTAPSGSYTESWRTNPDGGGISIKLATTQSQADVLQFEYTTAGDLIFWDLSCINMAAGSEFTQYGFSVTSNNPNCPSATCAAGDEACAAAYLYPSDNSATHGCSLDTTFTLTIGQ